MKAIAILILASLPLPQVQLPARPQPQPHLSQRTQAVPRQGGQWYFARSGHAVYCYGPVMLVPNAEGDLEHVATFCRGDRLLVPLKD
jgi:hypothetical protein